jgi:uncharacterized protein (TIGR00375 family)
LHSRYSRATSPDMNIVSLGNYAKIKGINLLGTGDFTHPNYFAELRLRLKPDGHGLFVLKKGDTDTRFILTAEVSNIFSYDNKVRKIHTLIFAPSFEIVEKINNKLKGVGNLSADGRPIFGQHVKDLVKMVLDISSECFIVPAHAWTPWFSLFGANSGFDSIEECFQEESKNIYCIETGLSSDPQMNWRLSALDKITLISNSDAHSPRKLGREANIFNCALDYKEIIDVLKTKDPKRFLYTVEFFPEEGKYHYDGHRVCNIIMTPEESMKHQDMCPVCRRKLTIGVMHRVAALADRPVGFTPPNAIPCKHMVPLEEIIGDALDVGPDTISVKSEYDKLIAKGGNEFNILMDIPLNDLARLTTTRIWEGIKLVREEKLTIVPGHDGVYGKISIFDKTQPHKPITQAEPENDDSRTPKRSNQSPQMSLF